MTELSIVMTARNDDYGGNLLHRMQSSIESILTLGDRHDLDGELVLVDWNPPADEPPLAEALDWPDVDFDARVVTVPPELHEGCQNSNKIPLMEYVAKNAGIRRANGEFVLSTNPDLVYSDELVEFFASGRLRDDRFYRIHRYDVDGLVPRDRPIDDQLSYAEAHTYKYSTVNDGYVTIDKSSRFRKEVGRFVDVVSKDPAKARYLVTEPGRVYDFLAEIYGNVFSTVDGDGDGDGDGDSNGDGDDGGDEVVSTPDGLEDVFLTSSGDFLLMAADSWDAINGYPEMGTNLHVDSFGCVYATKLGLDQAVLKDPLKIYHQDHDRSARDSRPAMERDELVEQARDILSDDDLDVYNDETWGLATADLEEVTVV